MTTYYAQTELGSLQQKINTCPAAYAAVHARLIAIEVECEAPVNEEEVLEEMRRAVAEFNL